MGTSSERVPEAGSAAMGITMKAPPTCSTPPFDGSGWKPVWTE